MTQQTTANASQSNGHAPGSGASPAAAEQTSLDALVEQFQSSQTASPAKAVADALTAFRPALEYVEEERATKATEKYKTAVSEVVRSAKTQAGLDDKFPDNFTRGFFRDYAAENADFDQAFINREQEPEAWQAQFRKANEAFKKGIDNLPTNKVRTDLEAGLSAVRNTSATPPAAVAFDGERALKMSDQEWDAHKHELIRAQQAAK